MPNSYLGQPYGFNVHEILLKPLSDNQADKILQEMREQIPPLRHLNNEQIKITRSISLNQVEKYFITINDSIHVELGDVDQSENRGDSFYAYGQ